MSRDGDFTVSRIGTFLASVVLVVVAVVAKAPPQGGWVSLFNGKDLTGWKNNGEEKWVVEQGTILCESAANKYGYLTTEKTYRDFHLRLKFKGEAAGNSGVFFHARITGIDPEHGPDIEGMQAEVDPSVGIATQPRPPLSYSPPVCLPTLGSTSACIPSISGPWASTLAGCMKAEAAVGWR